jgi:hypothetical protein
LLLAHLRPRPSRECCCDCDLPLCHLFIQHLLALYRYSTYVKTEIVEYGR